jgi:hypothetical protein
MFDEEAEWSEEEPAATQEDRDRAAKALPNNKLTDVEIEEAKARGFL